MGDLEAQPGAALDQSVAETMPHLDDRDFNSFSLNPSCNSTFSNIHNRTWVVHHVQPDTMRCMWKLDTMEEAMGVPAANSANDASYRIFPDLCQCSTDVEE